MIGLVVPRDFAQRINAGRDAPVQLIVNGSDSNTATIAIGYADVVAQIYAHGPDRRTEPAPRRTAAANPLGRAAAGLVQRGPGIAELHHSRADRRADDGDFGDAHLADRRPRVGARHDGATDLHADPGLAN